MEDGNREVFLQVEGEEAAANELNNGLYAEPLGDRDNSFVSEII